MNRIILTHVPTTLRIVERWQPLVRYPRIRLNRIRNMVWTRMFDKSEFGKCPLCQCTLCRSHTQLLSHSNNMHSSIPNWECSHLESLFHGGSNLIDNLTVLCGPCNRQMGTIHYLEYALRYRPPRMNHLITVFPSTQILRYTHWISQLDRIVLHPSIRIEEHQRFKLAMSPRRTPLFVRSLLIPDRI